MNHMHHNKVALPDCICQIAFAKLHLKDCGGHNLQHEIWFSRESGCPILDGGRAVGFCARSKGWVL